MLGYIESLLPPFISLPGFKIGLANIAVMFALCKYGTKEAFFDLYAITATHLKKCFPALKIGGPAVAGNMEWSKEFLQYQASVHTPIDFFSWHSYQTTPEAVVRRAEKMRRYRD